MVRAERYVCGDGRGNEWEILTLPGCFEPEHMDEVRGAADALILRGGAPWSDATGMDCGCVLSVDWLTASE
jgi:hypothetical protein